MNLGPQWTIDSVRIQSERTWGVFSRWNLAGLMIRCTLSSSCLSEVRLFSLPGSQASLPFLPLVPTSQFLWLCFHPHHSQNLSHPGDQQFPWPQIWWSLTFLAAFIVANLSFLPETSSVLVFQMLCSFSPIFNSVSSVSIADSLFSSRLWSWTLFAILCTTQVRGHLASDCPCSRIAPASSWNSDPDLPYSYLAPL